jgi:hypothetical protein
MILIIWGIGVILYFMSARIGWFSASRMTKSELIAEMLFSASQWLFGMSLGLLLSGRLQ